MSKERKASVIYEGNSSQKVFAINFDYLRKAFIKVTSIFNGDSKELSYTTDYTVTEKQVEFNTPPATGTLLKIYRQTTTDPLVEWQDSSVLRSADLSLQEVQLLHLAEETADKVFDSGMATAPTNSNLWDGQYKRIGNLLDPQNPDEAVTLRYIQANQSSLLNALKSEGAKQEESIVSTGDKQNTRVTTTGDTYVSTMTDLKDNTTTKASEASGSAELSKKWAMSSTSPDGVSGNKSSKTWAEEAKTSASNAKTSETNAKNVETTVNDYRTQTANSASAAKASETNAKGSEVNAKASEEQAKLYTDVLKKPIAYLNLLERNKTYSIGDIAYSPNLPSWAYLECTTAGTTGASEPDFSSVKSGGVILDGDAKFTIRTVCAKEYVDVLRAYVDSLRESDKVVEVPITNLVGTDYINEVSCQKSGHVVTVKFNVLKVNESAAAASESNAILKGFPKPVFGIVWVHASPLNSNTLLRGCLTQDYFSWHYIGAWQTSSGKECVCTFTYLTND